MKSLFLITFVLLNTSVLAFEGYRPSGVDGGGRLPGLPLPNDPRTINDNDLRNPFGNNGQLVCTQDGCVDTSDPDNDNVPLGGDTPDDDIGGDDEHGVRPGSVGRLFYEDEGQRPWQFSGEGLFRIINTEREIAVVETEEEYQIHESDAFSIVNQRALDCASYRENIFVISKICLND